MTEKLKIIVDTREQCQYGFFGDKYKDVEVINKKLDTGDYSLLGYENSIGIERKELSDIIGCLGNGRARFERELERAKQLEYFAVVIEASFLDIAKGNYRSAFNPHSACQSILAFSVRYNINFFFAGNRGAGEYITYSLLHKFLKQKESLTKPTN